MNTNLKKAVVAQLGYELSDIPDNEELMDDLNNITNNGISGGGFSGFVWFTETVKFFDDNQADIMELATELANDLGDDGVYSLIVGFNCLDLSIDEVVTAIHVPDDENETTVKNALAWFAGEEFARLIVDENE